MDQIKAVLAYSSTMKCRSQQLLSYFGEVNAEKCQFCDVCLAERKIEDAALITDKIDFQITTLLHQQHYNLGDFVALIQAGSEAQKIERIRELLDAGKIKSDGKNYYI